MQLRNAVITHLLFYCAFIFALGCRVRAAQYNTSAANTWIQTESDDPFSGRNGHAAVVFKEKLWVVGGTGELYQTYNFRYHKRRGDVWSSEDGFTWIQNNNLTGDFHLQNYDAADPGSLAPWYARFGHTLDVLAVPDSNGTATELMILAGGYTPNADNDVWVTEDGNGCSWGHLLIDACAWGSKHADDWRFAGNANWTGRGWHESSIFQDKLFIIGGSPLNNDVWAADIAHNAAGSWVFTWEAMSSGDDTPFSPRAGLAAAVIWQPAAEDADGSSRNNDTLFVMGGFGGWPEGDSRHDGLRCRNDVYKTKDGVTWSVVTEGAAWGPRGWFDVSTLTNVSDPYSDVTTSSSSRTMTGNGPRMWLAGGGYMGQNRNNIVYSMIGYVDMWFSSDGLTWHKVNYEEGEGSNLYSSMGWALTEVDNVATYLGKWGHRMLASTVEDGQGGSEPALYFIAGDTVGGGSFVSDVFVSTETLFCTLEGIVCGGVGTCVDFGCECPPALAGGDFCTIDLSDSKSAAARTISLPRNKRLIVVTTAVAATVFTGAKRNVGLFF